MSHTNISKLSAYVSQ